MRPTIRTYSLLIAAVMRYCLRAIFSILSSQTALIARTSAARSSTGIVGNSPLLLTGSLRR